MKSLKQRLEQYHTVSIIGTAKNAGKTTVLNKIIEEYKNEIIALTSIGLDGEKIDNVTYQEKPRIKVYPKMLIATALNCLKESSVEYVIYEKTGIRTPLGEIVIIEVTKKGLVLVGGPSTNTEMKKITSILKKYSPEKILIDGALFRKSIANSTIADGIILTTGASYNKSIEVVVEDTKTLIDQMQIKRVNSTLLNNVKNYENTFFYNQHNNSLIRIKKSLLYNEKILKEFLHQDFQYLYLRGALTNRIADEIFENRHEIKNLTIIVKDSTHILLYPQKYTKLLKIGVKIRVLFPIDIIFVAYNPYSPFGYSFDNLEFRALLREEIELPLINVLKDLE